MPYIPVLTNIVGIGNMAVDIFFFFSGLCLALSAEKHHYVDLHWKGYFRRRFRRVLIPYFLICVPFYAWAAVFESHGSLVRRTAVFLADLSSATFWLKGTQTTWYLYGIVVFYLLFPILYTYIENGSPKKTAYLLAGMIIFAVLANYIPVVKNSMIVWARLPIFTAGIAAGISDTDTDREVTKIPVIITAAAVLMIGTVTSVSEISELFTIPQVYRLLLYLPMTLAVLSLLSGTGGRKRMLHRIGGLSLEVYLIHITLLHPVKYYGLMDAAGYWLYLILPVITLLLAWAVGIIEKRILFYLDQSAA